MVVGLVVLILLACLWLCFVYCGRVLLVVYRVFLVVYYCVFVVMLWLCVVR